MKHPIAAARRFFIRHARLEIVQGDITKQDVDAIVNAAKPSLMGGGGVDGAIHRAAGTALLADCILLRPAYPNGLPTGHAVATSAGKLPARYVIHTVGPDRRIGQTNPYLLRSCYTASLHVADRLNAKTVAFPLISSGVYGWDTEDALRQAYAAIRATRTRVHTVRLVVFDDATYRTAQRVLRPIY